MSPIILDEYRPLAWELNGITDHPSEKSPRFFMREMTGANWGPDEALRFGRMQLPKYRSTVAGGT